MAVRIALTATAAPPVRLEICRRLGLHDPEVVIGDFDRPNIELSVRHARSPNDKQQLIAQCAEQRWPAREFDVDEKCWRRPLLAAFRLLPGVRRHGTPTRRTDEASTQNPWICR